VGNLISIVEPSVRQSLSQLLTHPKRSAACFRIIYISDLMRRFLVSQAFKIHELIGAGYLKGRNKKWTFQRSSINPNARLMIRGATDVWKIEFTILSRILSVARKMQTSCKSSYLRSMMI
jgi:hypothetical protein